MLPSYEKSCSETKLNEESNSNTMQPKKERVFPTLELTGTTENTLSTNMDQPILIIQSPKTPTLSRKLKAVSLDSEPTQQTSTTLEVSRDVFSMPNTPKRQMKNIKEKLGYVCEFDTKSTLGSNLKRFASNQSISGSQTLKTLPEIMTLHDFSDNRTEPVRIRAKGLLERRGSNASLTIDLGSSSNLSEQKPAPVLRLNAAKSVSNLNLSTFGYADKCICNLKKCETQSINDTKKPVTNLQNIPENKKHTVKSDPNACGSCTIYESVPKHNPKLKCQQFHKKCHCVSSFKCRRKSLSNENLYVPPCSFCSKECHPGGSRGYRKALYPRQPDLEASQLLSEDFKLHLQNVQYLQTAGSVLSIAELKASCEMHRLSKVHQEFWEVPLNLQEKCLVSGSQTRNRYRGVLPNEHTRVHLFGPQPYIHANYIKGSDYTETAYIATQGPMMHTGNEFWHMVWHCKATCIVMLTGLIERGRSKCELYFPLGSGSEQPKNTPYPINHDKFTFDHRNDDKEETHIFETEDITDFDSYTIHFIAERSLGECKIRDLELRRKAEGDGQDAAAAAGSNARKILHYWYSNWADHKMANPEQVLQIALHVLDAMKSVESEPAETAAPAEQVAVAARPEKCPEGLHYVPLVVHCSAGIGRTGCFLAILNGIQQLRTNYNVDVLAILCSLRLNRGGMVQTAEQYELIHRVLSLYADSLVND